MQENGIEDGSFMPKMIFYYVIICYVFSEATTNVLESFTKIPQENTCVEVFFKKSCRPADLFHVYFSLYPIIHVNYIKYYSLYIKLLWIFANWFIKMLEKKHFRTNIYTYGSQTFWSFMKFFFVLPLRNSH